MTKEKLKAKKIPKGELVLTSLDGEYVKETYRFAYLFDLYSENAAEANRVYIDAGSGTVLKRHALVDKCFSTDHAPAPQLSHSGMISSGSARTMLPFLAATFNSRYPRSNPAPSFEVEPFGSVFRLSMSTNVSQALQTRRDINNNLVWDDPDLTNPSLNWGNNEQDATLAHWTAWRTRQYFLNRYGLNGTDGQGTLARILIAPFYIDNAGWSQDQRMIVLGIHNGTILSSVDIVAHEYGHGVSAQLVAGWTVRDGETGALNEGFSDIIGTAIERELYPTGNPNEAWNYQLGEDVWLQRDMANPHNVIDRIGTGQPQIYHEAGFWDFNTNEIHHNNGVLNKWFHTLTNGNGPNGNNITPINFDDAMQIVYWGLDNYIYGDYNYPNAANALRIAAGAIFGECSPQQVAVRNAWGAVGIQLDGCNADCNFQPLLAVPSDVNCSQAMTLSTGCTYIPGISNG